ncbi:unnamed protein product, partial [Amoebophrya sp. A25]
QDHSNSLVFNNIGPNEPAVAVAATGNATAGTAADVTVRTFRNDLTNLFPMTGTLPLGGNKTITAFTFSNVEIPKAGNVWGARLVLCAADLLANLRFGQIGCTGSTDLVSPKATVEMDIFAVAASVTINDLSLASDSCYLHNLLRGSKKVTMSVTGSSWRQSAVFHQASGSTSPFPSRRDASADCQQFSVDIKSVVEEITSDASWSWGSSLTILIAEKGMYENFSCTAAAMAEEVVTGAQLVTALQKASTSPCDTIEDIKNKLNAHFPLWVHPFEDASNPDGQLAMLQVDWCLNAQCTSPHFYGAGADVKYGGSSETETTTVPSGPSGGGGSSPGGGGSPPAPGGNPRTLFAERGSSAVASSSAAEEEQDGT